MSNKISVHLKTINTRKKRKMCCQVVCYDNHLNNREIAKKVTKSQLSTLCRFAFNINCINKTSIEISIAKFREVFARESNWLVCADGSKRLRQP